jgi:hypothetical protein
VKIVTVDGEVTEVEVGAVVIIIMEDTEGEVLPEQVMGGKRDQHDGIAMEFFYPIGERMWVFVFLPLH